MGKKCKGEKIMEYDESKVYTAVTADKLKVDGGE